MITKSALLTPILDDRYSTLAIQFLKSLEVTEETKGLYRKTLQQAKQHNRKVFVLYGKAPRSALTLDDYQEEPYTPSQDDDEAFTSKLQ